MIALLEAYLKQKGIELQREYRFCKRRWRLDYMFRYHTKEFRDDGRQPDTNFHLVAIEIEGGIWLKRGAHNTGKAMLRDMSKYNAAQLMGIQVYRFTPDQIKNNEEIELVEKLLNG